MAQSEYWKYNPSLVAAVIATIAFVALTIYHVYRLLRNKTWFCVPFVIGGIFEIVGYGARTAGHYNMNVLVPFLLQALLTLLAPILFAASIYMFLGRLIRATDTEAYSIIRVGWLTKIFVGGDIGCFLIQALGAALLASAKISNARTTGEIVILVGLVLQIVIFGVFLVAALIYHKRLRAQPNSNSLSAKIDWNLFMIMLYGVSGLITLRNLFRVIEYAMGDKGYLLQTEWPVYVLDALPMAVVLAVCSNWHVGKLQPRSEAIELNNEAADLVHKSTTQDQSH